MAKDRVAKHLQKKFGIKYMQALQWKNDRKEEIKLVVEQEGKRYEDAAEIVFKRHEEDDWVENKPKKGN